MKNWQVWALIAMGGGASLALMFGGGAIGLTGVGAPYGAILIVLGIVLFIVSAFATGMYHTLANPKDSFSIMESAERRGTKWDTTTSERAAMNATARHDAGRVSLYVGEELLGPLGQLAPALTGEVPSRQVVVVVPGLRFHPARTVVRVPASLAWRMLTASRFYRVQTFASMLALLIAGPLFVVAGVGVINHSQTIAGAAMLGALFPSLLYGLLVLAAFAMTVPLHPRYAVPPGIRATNPRWVVFRGIAETAEIVEFVHRHQGRAVLMTDGTTAHQM